MKINVEQEPPDRHPNSPKSDPLNDDLQVRLNMADPADPHTKRDCNLGQSKSLETTSGERKTALFYSLMAIEEFLQAANIKKLIAIFDQHKRDPEQFYRDFYNTYLYRMSEEEAKVVTNILRELDVTEAEQKRLFDAEQAKRITMYTLFLERHRNVYNASEHCQINRVLEQLHQSRKGRWSLGVGIVLIALGVCLGWAIWTFSLPTLMQCVENIYNVSMTDFGRSMVGLVAGLGLSGIDIYQISLDYRLSSVSCNKNLLLCIVQLMLHTVPAIINIGAYGLSIPLLFGSLAVIVSFMDALKARNAYLDAQKNVLSIQKKFENNKTGVNYTMSIQDSYRSLRNVKRFSISSLSNKKVMRLNLYAAIASILISGLIAFTGIGIAGYTLTIFLMAAKIIWVRRIHKKAEALLEQEIREDYDAFKAINAQQIDVQNQADSHARFMLEQPPLFRGSFAGERSATTEYHSEGLEEALGHPEAASALKESVLEKMQGYDKIAQEKWANQRTKERASIEHTLTNCAATLFKPLARATKSFAGGGMCAPYPSHACDESRERESPNDHEELNSEAESFMCSRSLQDIPNYS